MHALHSADAHRQRKGELAVGAVTIESLEICSSTNKNKGHAGLDPSKTGKERRTNVHMH
jgi:hypothetical protein